MKQENPSPLQREDLLEILETTAHAQLRALRLLRRPAPERAQALPPPQSSMALVQAILLQAGQPLHIQEIIARARKQYGRQLRRESLVSALTKKVLDQNTFRRTAPNTFDLLRRPGPR
jgi:chromosome segregation and condensation protein ScpB